MVQGGEWIVIVLVALVVFGPERLPELSRKLGGWARELRNAAREMREGLEAEVSEVQKAKADLTDPVKEVRQAVRDTARLAAETNPTRLEWKGPKPLSGPTPDQALADLDRIEAGQAPVEEAAVPIDQASGADQPEPGSLPPSDRSTDSSEEPT
ncbi:MAG TPA: twin-arginine translocase TatA/TatE family subunit [Acidimicrobiia bacterium]|nr:twin-arginine translocase TatA/TatE family subunit [Acidimicrobiia bacterium]